ncbi:hypothetical protein [Kitasatospora sp. NPDC001175]|uniref:hypothetical protein n=1 Tax=Kitasatospora sp. NPDC001175 TaxID=3157103 RepID=UPI003D0836B8
MAAWLWKAWLQVWPNLAANVIWVPVVGIHHLLVRRHLRHLHNTIRRDQYPAATESQEH